MSRSAVIAGATGLVGQALLRQLLADVRYARVVSVSRRPPELSHPKLQSLVRSLDELEAQDPALNADDAFCCLGTTTAKAGKVGLERVDYHMVVGFARAARAAGATRFVGLSSLGAAARSPAFYSRVKARMEQAVGEIAFDAVDILRPSLLLGARDEARPLEAFAQRLAPLLSPLFSGPLRAYRPVTAEAVAAAMIALAQSPAAGVRIHTLPLDLPPDAGRSR